MSRTWKQIFELAAGGGRQKTCYWPRSPRFYDAQQSESGCFPQFKTVEPKHRQKTHLYHLVVDPQAFVDGLALRLIHCRSHYHGFDTPDSDTIDVHTRVPALLRGRSFMRIRNRIGQTLVFERLHSGLERNRSLRKQIWWWRGGLQENHGYEWMNYRKYYGTRFIQ